jgi:hypothetical protein
MIDPVQAAPQSVVGTERTVSDYLEAFGPMPSWDELVAWPPDVFALTNLVLEHTESYRFAVAPPRGAQWPPFADWEARVGAAAEEWMHVVPDGELPDLVSRCWDIVTRGRGLSMASIRSGTAWDEIAAMLTLHAIADEACVDVVSTGSSAADASFEASAWRLLQRYGSLARLSPARIRIIPKTRFVDRGITIRSISRYLALSYESVDVRWCTAGTRQATGKRRFRILLVPWPSAVSANDFRPSDSRLLANMEADRYGFFEFAPESLNDHGEFTRLLQRVVEQGVSPEAVVLPEAAVAPEEVPRLEQTLAEHGVHTLIGGVREPSSADRFGRNYLHLGFRNGDGWRRHEQDKHHRWCLDEGQIGQYHLARALDPRRLWWEAIDIRERVLHVIDMGGGVTVTPLICEDLARLDEVAALVRTLGPSLVIALLLDGPQLAPRWPCRYGSLITDDPGSAVLTLTSYGMATRARPPGKPESRVIAHWNSPDDGPHEIELARDSGAVVITLAAEDATLWTADGRRHAAVPRLALAEVEQVDRASSNRHTVPASVKANADSSSVAATGRNLRSRRVSGRSRPRPS